ncbi:MAG: hypothetical protein JWN44_6273 [Myxococcales bacterium]|nr:hypothetical protein [Myxococcales bacterium]
MVVAIVAGCNGGSPTTATSSTSVDPLAQKEATLNVESVGDAAGPWPTPVVRIANGWVIPWSDGGAIHARFVGDDGARTDRVVDRGTFVGATATADGYALVVAADGNARVHFVAGDSDDLVTAPLDGKPVLAAASDGARILVASTRGGDIAIEDPRPLDATLLLVGREGARAIDLGRVAAAPSLWGDADGFIVAGTLTLDAGGRIAPAPGRQIRDARLFRAPVPAGTQPTSDRITIDGSRWLEVDGLVGWAARDGSGARLEVVRPEGRDLVEVGEELTPRLTRTLPATTRGDAGQSWVAAADAGRVVWAATRENDPVFAILDALDMHTDSPVIRISQPSSRTIVVSPGASSVLFAWTEGGQNVHFFVLPW